MTLNEIFEKYPDTTDRFYRKSHLEIMKSLNPYMSEDAVLDMTPKHSIEDANADDWELYRGEL